MRERKRKAYAQGVTVLRERDAEKISEAESCGIDWLLFGIEERRRDPIDENMIRFLWSHPDVRKAVHDAMNAESFSESKASDFPERLRNFRKRCHLTQTQVGELLGVSAHTVMRMEKGKSRSGKAALDRMLSVMRSYEEAQGGG